MCIHVASLTAMACWKGTLTALMCASLEGVGNFVNTGVLVALFPIYSTIAPTRGISASTGKATQTYQWHRLDGVRLSSPAMRFVTHTLHAVPGVEACWNVICGLVASRPLICFSSLFCAIAACGL